MLIFCSSVLKFEGSQFSKFASQARVPVPGKFNQASWVALYLKGEILIKVLWAEFSTLKFGRAYQYTHSNF
jgi:hypothetical protein